MAQNISKVPKGGKKVNIGADKIMGNPPINSLPGMDSLISFLQSKGISNLDQISQWDATTHVWMRWEFPPIPQRLKGSFDNFCKHLHSIAPTFKIDKDELRWDPTGTSYTIQAGYDYLNSKEHSAPTWIHWKILRKAKAIPKVKFFMWILLKGKTLTAENLKRRGIAAPSRCRNCQDAEESMQHLFISCPFAVSCWSSINPSAFPIWNTQQSIGKALINWKRNYPWQSMKHNPAKRVWDALPFALLWRIWIARNNMIFREKETSSRHLCMKAKILAIETIASKQEDFSSWLRSSNSHSLFFDGASKSNPGAVGAGGIIFSPSGDPLVSFKWKLGTLSNNRAEALALYQGILQLQAQEIKKSLIFGDSAIIITLMNSRRKASNIFMQQTISRCKDLISHNQEFHFYHILRSINREADKRASQACSWSKGSLLRDNIP
eukprot:PITA_11184